MARESDISTLLGQNYFIGLSAATGITLQTGQVAALVKNYGGGTLWFGLTSLSVPGTGYLMGATEVLPIDCVSTFYLASQGATAQIMVLIGKTVGT